MIEKLRDAVSSRCVPPQSGLYPQVITSKDEATFDNRVNNVIHDMALANLEVVALDFKEEMYFMTVSYYQAIVWFRPKEVVSA